MDIDLPRGTAVLAAREGMVESVEENHGRDGEEQPPTFEGNFVRVRHADESYATYAHLAPHGVRVHPGERVAEGQLLGYSGASGEVEGPLLHFGVSRFEKDAAGRPEEISLPVMFSVGRPPFRFEPRAHMIATPAYDGPAEWPRFAGETPRKFEPPRTPTDDEELNAWLRIAGFFVIGVAMMLVSSWLALGMESRAGRGGREGRSRTHSLGH